MNTIRSPVKKDFNLIAGFRQSKPTNKTLPMKNSESQQERSLDKVEDTISKSSTEVE